MAPKDSAAWYGALGARLSLAWTLGGDWRFEAHADASAPLSRTGLGLNGPEVWKAPLVAGILGVGVAIPAF